MKVRPSTKSLACLALAATAIIGDARAANEAEPNNTPAEAMSLNIVDGTPVSGTLLPGSVIPITRDQDYYTFTNTNGHTSISVKISVTGIGVAEHVSYEVLTAAQTPVFPPPLQITSGSEVNMITSPNPGTTFFIRVFDDGTLTPAASGEAAYTIEVKGIGGVNPIAAYNKKQIECRRALAALNKAKAKAKATRRLSDIVAAAQAFKRYLRCKRDLAALKAKL